VARDATRAGVWRNYRQRGAEPARKIVGCRGIYWKSRKRVLTLCLHPNLNDKEFNSMNK
jgi:hypothetical protein